ncbi:flagella basal body P-ring formation protein FlgA [Denitrovibrio acetiphilus DSM 12809]|uniref:Flagella basal body P-ring formation protein FlgA n=1 Tax=Denitrovibrio acetiphilus (strain DSM 12809 / NBRC 114555 / N2460) TaxID=522772 RepID=D4H4A9_DENA2|nr:flagellar basal body P-ring formation chaperone FlgA [Denitrovibrio acetiphilus]ADD69238.1 flagella basal body P-ring formation protein FlgA [Denitrovibrio acetiphilus DSM 12809]
MLKPLLMGLIFVCTVLSVSANDVIVIDSECIMLEDIFPGIGIKDDIYCGLDYGEERTINRQMSMYIINKHDIVGAQPGEVTFRRKGTLLTEDRFKSDVQDLLSVMYGSMDIEIGSIRMGRDFYYSEKDGYNIDMPKGRFGNVSVSIDNGVRRYNYTINLKAFQDIYVTSSSIRKGEDVSGRVQKERYELSRVHGEPVKDPSGMIATKNLSSGRPLTLGDVMMKPDAFEGTTVLLVYRSGALNVTTSGELQEDAYIGKNVRVKNTASGKIVRGRYEQGRKVVVNAQ